MPPGAVTRLEATRRAQTGEGLWQLRPHEMIVQHMPGRNRLGDMLASV